MIASPASAAPALSADQPAWAAFSREKILVSVVFGPSGQLIGVDDLRAYSAFKGSIKRMTVPQARLHTHGFGATFLWGNTIDALGLRPNPHKTEGYRLDQAAFEQFRDLHSSLLHDVVDTSVQAFLRFLQQWTPEHCLGLEELKACAGSNVAFRFRYDDEFVHEKHAAHVAWLRALSSLDSHTALSPMHVASSSASQPHRQSVQRATEDFDLRLVS